MSGILTPNDSRTHAARSSRVLTVIDGTKRDERKPWSMMLFQGRLELVCNGIENPLVVDVLLNDCDHLVGHLEEFID